MCVADPALAAASDRPAAAGGVNLGDSRPRPATAPAQRRPPGRLRVAACLPVHPTGRAIHDQRPVVRLARRSKNGKPWEPPGRPAKCWWECRRKPGRLQGRPPTACFTVQTTRRPAWLSATMRSSSTNPPVRTGPTHRRRWRRRQRRRLTCGRCWQRRFTALQFAFGTDANPGRAEPRRDDEPPLNAPLGTVAAV